MQETQYGLRQAQEDYRWMVGEADLGNVLTPFSTSAVAPVSLEAASQPQLELRSALVTLSVDINALAQEQVRLRETLETLNSTLPLAGKTLATKTADVGAGTSGSDQEKPWSDKAQEMGKDAVKFVGKEVLTSLWDTAKERVSGKALDAVADKFPTAAKWLKDDKAKAGNKGTECCCTGALPADIRGSLGTVTAQLPENIGETVRSEGKARPTGRRNKTRQSRTRVVKSSVVRKSADLKPQRNAPAAPLLNAMGVPPLPFDSSRVSHASARLPGNGFASSAAPTPARASARGTSKGLAQGLSGVLGKLESAGARRLGPMKYVDTAMDVVQGVRNGDAKAIGSGLSTAGGAWAGASAGAAVGTLIFPGVGTAVGGAIGGLLGSEAGSWLGEKLFGSSDLLPAPNAVSKQLNNARTDNVQVTLAPSIQITGVNPADSQQVVNQVIQALQFQCMPMVTDTLGLRRNAALADPSGGD